MQPTEPAYRRLLIAQRNEITEHRIYSAIAARTRDANNRQVLERIANEELRHYEFLRNMTGRDVTPDRLKVASFRCIIIIFGMSFGLRLMERGEKVASDVYEAMGNEVADVTPLLADEQRHEKDLLSLIEEERIEYAGAVVLGLNDALMELTGALSGLTFALQDGRLIAATGFITGIAASMSMAASAFLSSREDKDQHAGKNPFKSAAYTGIAYVLTVLILISPYLLVNNVYASLVIMLTLSVLIVLGYNFYITTAKGLKLWRRFAEMAIISICVALITFGIGVLVRTTFGIEV